MPKPRSRWIRLGIVFLISIAARWAILLCGAAACGWLSDGSFLESWLAFLTQAGDAPHYLQIAEVGYLSAGDTVNNIVFYPLYPLLMRGVSYITGDLAWAGIVLSNVCLGFAGCSLYTLFGEVMDDRDGIRSAEALAFFLCYPFGMFLTGIYTESLYLLLASLTLLSIYRRRWWGVALFGFLTAISRAQGVVLLLPAAYEWLLDLRQKRRGIVAGIFAMLAIPAGFGAFLVLNKVVTGDFFAFVEYEAAAPWYNTSHWIPENLTSQWNMAVEYDYLGMLIYWVQILLYFAGVIGIAVGILRGGRASFMAYGGAYICVSYLHGWLIYGPRYMMGCLPLFPLAAGIRSSTVKYGLLALSAILSVAYMVMYLRGGAIM